MPSNSTESGARRSPLWANLLLSALVTVLLFLLVEGFSSLLMATKAARRTLYMREESHARYDVDLGWSHKPAQRVDDLYGPGASFTTNARGFRGLEEIDAQPPAGRYRIIALGDSFTMGFGVGDEASYPARLQAACPTLQTVNMGQGGYGVDQSYLWYKRDGLAQQSQLLLVAPIAHDFFRMDKDSFIGYPKPVLKIEQGALVVKNVPVPPTWHWRTPKLQLRAFVDSLALVRVARALLSPAKASPPEQFYGPVSDEVFAAAGLALDDLATLSKARGQGLVLVYLPVEELLPAEPSREAQWMEAHALKAQLPFINLVADFQRLAPAERAAMFRVDNHYSDAGNRLVAAALLRQLGTQVAGFPACLAGAAP